MSPTDPKRKLSPVNNWICTAEKPGRETDIPLNRMTTAGPYAFRLPPFAATGRGRSISCKMSPCAAGFLSKVVPGKVSRRRLRNRLEPGAEFGAISLRTFILAALLPVAVPTAVYSAPADFADLVDIGDDRKIYLECRGTGSPTVVLVAGLKASAEDWSIAEKTAPTVFPEVAKFTRVCAYDRPGTPVGEKPSRSDPVPQPTTAGDAVADLHALLNAAG